MRGTGKLLKLIFIKWKYSLTILTISIILIQSLLLSLQKENPVPFLSEVGHRVLSFDYNLEVETKKVVDGGGVYINSQRNPTSFFEKIFKYLKVFWSYIITLSGIIIAFWMIYMLYTIFYWIFSRFDDSSKMLWAILVILLLLSISVMYSLISGYANSTYNGWKDVDEAFKFKGVASFWRALPLLINPIYQDDPEYLVKNLEPAVSNDIISEPTMEII